MNKKRFIVPALLFFILIIGFLLRGQEILSNNYLFLKDQGRDMLDIKAIVFDHKLTLIGPYTGLQGVFQGPLYYYLLAIPTAIGKGDPRWPLAFIVALQLVGLIGVYGIGKRFFSPRAGLFAAFLFAVSPVAVAASTYIWSPHLTLPVMTFLLYWFFLWLEAPTLRRFVFVICSLGLLYHLEIAFAAPLTLVFFFLFTILLKKRFFPKMALIFIAVILFFLSPLFVFDVKHNFITSGSVLRLFSGKTQGLGQSFEPMGKIAGDHLFRFQTLLWSSFVDQKHPISRLLTTFFGGVIGWFLVWKRDKKLSIVSAIAVLMFIVYLLYPFQIYHWYIIGLMPVIVLLMGVAFDWISRWKIGAFLILLVILLISSDAAERLYRLYTVVDDGGTGKIKGKIAAIDYIYQDAGGKPFNLFIFTPVVLTDAYDYLLWWHGRRMYGYLPGKEKKGVFYLLAEPDYSKPWSYQGWMETVIKTGKVIETKELPSGFIIQKRISEEKSL